MRRKCVYSGAAMPAPTSIRIKRCGVLPDRLTSIRHTLGIGLFNFRPKHAAGSRVPRNDGCYPPTAPRRNGTETGPSHPGRYTGIRSHSRSAACQDRQGAAHVSDDMRVLQCLVPHADELSGGGCGRADGAEPAPDPRRAGSAYSPLNSALRRSVKAAIPSE